MTTKDTYQLEVRRVETPYYETGGAPERVDVTYEAGAMIGGKWVKFAGVAQNYIDTLPDAKQAAEGTTAEGK